MEKILLQEAHMVMEDHSVFPLKVIGIINSMIRPLLSSLISLDDFAQEYFEELDVYGQIKEIQDQVQCVAQDFFELRTLTLLSADGKLRAEKPTFTNQATGRAKAR